MSETKTTVAAAEPAATEPVAPPLKMDVSARPIEPKGNLVGFASIRFNDAFVVDDFKILQGAKGLFVGMPSKPDQNSKTGYRDTARPITAECRAALTEAVVTAYHGEVEKIKARAAAVDVAEKPPDKPSVQKQLAEGTEKAAKAKAAPAKKAPAHEAR